MNVSNRKKNFYLAIVLLVLISCSKDDDSYENIPSSEARLYAGGNTTVFSNDHSAFAQPAANLNGAEMEKHLQGEAHFMTNFVPEPAGENGGRGPIFNNSACINCHLGSGGALFPSDMNEVSGFLIRASIPGQGPFGTPNPVPGFGTQIQNQAVPGHQPEAQYHVTYSTQIETLADGTQVILKNPHYSLINPYQPLPENVMLSPRFGPPVYGLGLLEAIPETEILSYADEGDSNTDGISGKPNYVYDPVVDEIRLGRFGLKANGASVLDLVVGALHQDMGVTNPVFSEESGSGQTNGEDGLDDDPEVSGQTVDQLQFYARTLGVPAPRNIDDPKVIQGEKIFKQINCAKCHIEKMTTGPSDISALANQTIFPYTDLLLHDMGEGLADHRPDRQASGREWKTRPLWGIGMTKIVGGEENYLHDGRAKTITQAILWHDGEAKLSKNMFKSLSTKKREELLEFIHSL